MLSILWFILIAVLWIGYLVLEGFDLGVAMLLPFVSKNDKERTTALKTIGPHWDGNEVWLLTAGGAMFAAFPEWYATMFSGMYLALFVVLVLLILRIAALEWRSKIATEKWRAMWDRFHVVAGYGVPILMGCAFANLVHGMKIEVVTRAGEVVPPEQVTPEVLANASHQLTGGFFSLLMPFNLLGGIAVAAICFSHAAQFLSLKTDGILRERANAISGPASIAATALAAVWVLWGQFAYATSATSVFAWIPLVIAALALIAAAAFSQKQLRREGWAFICSTVAIAAAVAWIFTIMAPNVMKSSIAPEYSLTIEQASSTTGTLTVMTIVAVCLVPVVLAYTAWSYYTFRRRISTKDVHENAGLLPQKIRLGEDFLAG